MGESRAGLLIGGTETEICCLKKVVVLDAGRHLVSLTRVVAMQNTDFFDMEYSFFVIGLLLREPIQSLMAAWPFISSWLSTGPGRNEHCVRQFARDLFFRTRIDRPTQGDATIRGG